MDVSGSVRDRVRGDNSPPAIRRFARQLGLRLEVDYVAGRLRIAAYELQTGVRMRDLPGMGRLGAWRSWRDSLAALEDIA
jgi:hypothetical protein